MTTTKLRKAQLPFPDTIGRTGQEENGTDYCTAISTVTVGVNGDQTEVTYETNPDIFALSPTARRRAILGSAALQAFVQALWPLGVKGVPAEETLQEEYDRVLAMGQGGKDTVTGGDRRTRTRRTFKYGAQSNS